MKEVAGRAFMANRAWLRAGAGRPLRHARELSRLELFYHSFLPSSEYGWDFVRETLAEFPARIENRGQEWHPYSVSNRLAYWLEFLARSGPSPDPQLEAEAAALCRQWTDYLEWLPELDIGANHLLKNRWAVALSDALLENSQDLREKSVDAYLNELVGQMLPDGGHFELCPMYHAKVLADAQLLNGALPPSHPAAGKLEPVLSQGARWLESMRLAPQTWAGFNDSWEIPDLAATLWPEAGWVPAAGIVHLRDSGFIRATAQHPGGWRWLLDVGGVGPDFNPGHCHSDVLSLILNVGDEPLLVDPGTLHYSPNDERAFLKSCHAHNGPCLAERDHTEMVGSFRIGQAARCAYAEVAETDGRMSAFGHHRGYRDVEIGRRVEADTWGVRVEDTWTPTGNRTGAPWSRMLWAVPIRQLREVEVLGDRIGFRLPADHPLHAVVVQIRANGASAARLCVAESFYSAEFGRTREATETIVTAGRLQTPVSVETQMQIT
jgi:hypothetical protein